MCGVELPVLALNFIVALMVRKYGSIAQLKKSATLTLLPRSG